MLNVGIVTFHASDNCGSVLQTFALQKVLKDKFNTGSEVIDFSNDGQKELYRPFWKVTGIKSLIKNALWATVYGEIKKQINAYKNFRDKYLKLSSNSYSETNELVCLNDKYDKFITGSDQVWNIKCLDADDAYYLSFADDEKKYAYAVSFGANNPFIGEKGEHYIQLANSFKRISVRENNAQKWTKNVLKKDIQICLDPTLLLDENQWANYIDIGDEPIIKGKYILYYCFSISQSIARFLQQISKKYNMPVYFLEPKEWALRCCWKNNIKLVGKYGPEVFLNMMKNADIVFTTSFHGTVFSAIFHKKFWYIDSGHNDPEKDDRAISILNQLGLYDRYRTTDWLSNAELDAALDYKETDRRLEKLKEESFEYLKEIINE
jgi:hypothetical protein